MEAANPFIIGLLVGGIAGFLGGHFFGARAQAKAFEIFDKIQSKVDEGIKKAQDKIDNLKG